MAIDPDRTACRQLFSDYIIPPVQTWRKVDTTLPREEGLYWTAQKERDSNSGTVELTYWWQGAWSQVPADKTVICWMDYDRQKPGWPATPNDENLQFDFEDIT